MSKNNHKSRIYPNWDQIEKLKPAPTEGERALLRHLDEKLPFSFEIFFQPSLNGDKPDIAIMEEKFGLMIIEVKDWNLGSYISEETSFKKYYFNKEFYKIIRYKEFFVKKGNKKHKITGPLQQVGRYVDNLINLYEPEIAENSTVDQRENLFRKGIYFHKSLTAEAHDFIFFDDPKLQKKGMEKCEVFGYDDLDDFVDFYVIPRWHIPGASTTNINEKGEWDDAEVYREIFPNDWVKKIRFWLKPPFHELESGEPIKLTRNQLNNVELSPKQHQRIKGVAGSGKTLVIAQRAANLAQAGKKVLVISFNITLWHYIRDFISRARYGFSWDRIEFNHFHGFCKNFLKENDIEWPRGDDDEILNSIVPKKVIDALKNNQNRKNRRYDAILIDEGQDFRHLWYEMLCLLLSDNDELLLVKDEKQNIYQRDTSWVDNMANTKFRGRWRLLKETMRMPNKVLLEANRFSDIFLSETDSELKLESPNQDIDQFNFLDPHMVWRNIETDDKKSSKNNYLEKETIDKVMLCYHWLTEQKQEHPQDIVILLPGHGEGLQLVGEFKKRFKGLKINHVFEKTYNGRRSTQKKKSFWMQSPRLKMCTIHSFKGWELKNIILISPDNYAKEKESIDMLLYTSITRTRGNIIVFNRMKKYKDYGEEWPDKW